LPASSEGTSYPETSPYLDQNQSPRVADLRDCGAAGVSSGAEYVPPRSRYCGSSRSRPRRGQARTPHAVTAHICGHQCASLPPSFLRTVGGKDEACRRFCQVRLDLGENPYGGIAVWAGAQVWVERQVTDAYYRRYYSDVARELRKQGQVALGSIKRVALAMALAADHDTGQESRLSNATLMTRTGLGKSTVQRARKALRLLGVATEVLRGRQRSYVERMGSWRVGDKARGWASVWALHPATPVDRTRIIRAGQVQMAPHHRRGLSSSESSCQEKLTTERTVDKRAASRRSRAHRGLRASLTDPRGAVLASRWLRAARTPGWARKHAVTTWAPALASPATHGWNPDDINQIIDDWATDTGITPGPQSPVAFLRWLLSRHDLAFSPTLLETARRDQAQAEAELRRTQTAAQLLDASSAREAARVALDGPGRQLVRQALADLSTAAATRKATAIRAAHSARAEQVARARDDR